MKLVLLPGLDGTGRLFEPLLESLPASLSPQVIAYPRHKFLSYAELSRYAQERLPADEDYALLAESFSGPIAIEVAASRPHNLKAVILCATFVSNPAPASRKWGRLLHARLFALKPPLFVVRTLLLGHKAPQYLYGMLTATVRSVSPEVLAGRLREVMGVDAREAFGLCRAPVLYLAAQQDKLVGRGSVSEMLAIKPGMEVREIEGPHLLLQAAPKECVDAIDGFVARVA